MAGDGTACQQIAEAYLARLIRRGFRVAVCEQMEDPKLRTGKAPIRREVVRLVTPGTITEEALLEGGRANLLLALAQDREGIGAAWLDVSTGLFETAAVTEPELASLLGRLEPAEILAPATLPLGEWSAKRAPDVVPSPPLVARATRRSRVPGSSRALGWDTMLPTSSCGTRMSTSAFGHVGFTGTSLWIDPDREMFVVLLTKDEAAEKKRSLAALREWVDHSKHRLEEWQKQVDGKIRSTIEGIQHSINPWAGVQKDVKTLAERIAELEAELHELEQHEENKSG
jgi:polyhydroxyalkanoate synthesis regulator phasin